MASRDTLEDLIIYYEARDPTHDSIVNTIVLLYADIAYLAKEIKKLRDTPSEPPSGVLHLG